MSQSTWITVGSVILGVMMLAFLIPRAKYMFDNSRKAEPGEWQGVALPILVVVGFILFLMWVI